jgi:hypothetical protein
MLLERNTLQITSSGKHIGVPLAIIRQMAYALEGRINSARIILCVSFSIVGDTVAVSRLLYPDHSC